MPVPAEPTTSGLTSVALGGSKAEDSAAAVGEIAARFAAFGAEAVGRLPLYRRLCEAASTDLDVARRLLVARPDQQVPNLLLAAVHDVLLSGRPDPLAAWYGSVTPHPRAVGPGDDDPWPDFRRLALGDVEVDALLRTKATQTNEVGRCGALLPALAAISADAPGAPTGGGRPLSLVEVGASAGLNLMVDHYGYRYGPTGPVIAPDAALVIDVELRPRSRPASPFTGLAVRVPHVVDRVGVDLEPVDIGNPGQARWLVACQWPEQPERVHRARTALALAHGDRPTVRRGDALEATPELVRRTGRHALPVVLATWVLAYLGEARQREFMARLDQVGAERDLSLVCAEQPERVRGLAVPPRPDGLPDGRPTALVRVDWRDGHRRARRLADMHPHGTWLEWFPTGS